MSGFDSAEFEERHDLGERPVRHGVVRSVALGDDWTPARHLAAQEARFRQEVESRFPNAIVHPHILASGVKPDSVTHFVCPTLLIDHHAAPGDDNTTHHLVPRAAGLTCRWCGKTEAALRREIGLEQ